MLVKELLGVSFSIENPRDRIPYVKDRNFAASYMIAELLWYLSGNDSTEWISNYSSFWSKISDDGKTANSAYGARIFKPHERIASTIDAVWTQWHYVVEELVKDNDSRRAVIHIRSPQDSILANLDVPCTLTLQFFLRNNRVHCVASMRSSDIILGLAYDVPAFTIFQEVLAIDLSLRLKRQIGLGRYTHISNSLHLYERHFDMADRIVKSKDRSSPDGIMPVMPKNYLYAIHGLSKFEKACREAKLSTDLFHVMKQITSFLEVQDDYWHDWARILGAHRAKKLGNEMMHDDLISETSFPGYRFFKK